MSTPASPIGGVYPSELNLAVSACQDACHGAAAASGWWKNLKTGEDLTLPEHDGLYDASQIKFNVPEKLMLIVSEVAEGMEGFRKSKMDEHLPHRTNLEVELADAFIRICDLAGGMKFDLAGAVVEKLQYNAQRPDHKIESRQKDDGKKF